MNYRGREKRLVSFPLPPNRTGGSPASGSPVGGSPARGLTTLRAGGRQRKQPLRSKERIGPMDVVRTASTAFPLPPMTEDTAQAHSYPFIQRRKRGLMTVLEVTEPTH